jgi:hypothetical protein
MASYTSSPVPSSHTCTIIQLFDFFAPMSETERCSPPVVMAYTSGYETNRSDNGGAIYATSLGSSEAYAIPVYAEAVQPVPDNQSRPIFLNSVTVQRPPRLNIVVGDRGGFSENIVRVLALSRSLKCMTIVDAITVIIGAIFNLFWVLFIWGPIAGFYGVTRHRISFLYVYVIYWIIRIVIDLVSIVRGFWWHIISLLVDVYILRYLRLHIFILRSLTPDQLQLLQQYQSNQLARNNPYNV